MFLTDLGEQEPRRAAIKLIAEDSGIVEVQLSGWKLAAELSHPHLIRLFQMGRSQLGNTALLYVVMEYAEENLSQILPDRPLTPAESHEMLAPVLDVLSDLHGKGFMHGHLTQRLPPWEKKREAEPVVPETLPQPFLDIARNCLRRDPQRRWTVADIKARLQSSSSVLREQTAIKPPKQFAKWRYIVPTAVGLALLAMLAVPRRRPDVLRIPSSPLEQPEVERPTGGLVRGAVVNQVVPDVSQSVRDTIRGTVRVTVRVAVDPSGNVTGATLDSPRPSKYFADLALHAAHSWKFRPPEIDGRRVASEWILRFQFERAATKVVPQEAAP